MVLNKTREIWLYFFTPRRVQGEEKQQTRWDKRRQSREKREGAAARGETTHIAHNHNDTSAGQRSHR